MANSGTFYLSEGISLCFFGGRVGGYKSELSVNHIRQYKNKKGKLDTNLPKPFIVYHVVLIAFVHKSESAAVFNGVSSSLKSSYGNMCLILSQTFAP